MNFIAGAVLGGLAVWVLRDSVIKAFESGKKAGAQLEDGATRKQAARVPGGPMLVAPRTVFQE